MGSEWKYHFLTVRRMREILAHLESTDCLAATDIGTLAIVRDGKYIGFVDTWGGGNGVVSASDDLPSLEIGDTGGLSFEDFETLRKALQ